MALGLLTKFGQGILTSFKLVIVTILWGFVVPIALFRIWRVVTRMTPSTVLTGEDYGVLQFSVLYDFHGVTYLQSRSLASDCLSGFGVGTAIILGALGMSALYDYMQSNGYVDIFQVRIV